MASILLIDDDASLREVARFALEKAGFTVHQAADGRAGLEAAERCSPELIILDVLMPGMDGLEVCRTLRATSTVPIIFLTSVDEETDRIVGLELGADDYVTKPFSPRELVARVKAVLRRARPTGVGPTPEPGPTLRHGALVADLEEYRVRYDGAEVALSATEFAILTTLLRRPGKVFPRDELMDKAYRDGTVVSDRTIDTHIKRIRQKFEPLGVDPIATVHGIGYRLGDVSAHNP